MSNNHRQPSHPQRGRALLSSLAVLLFFGLLLLSVPAQADLVAGKFGASGAGGCGNFIDSLTLAEDGDALIPMIPPVDSGGAVITKNIWIIGGWAPPTNGGCDAENQTFTDTAALLAAGFTFNAPAERSTLTYDTGSVLTIDSRVVTLTIQHIAFDHQGFATPRGGGISGVISNGAEVRLENILVQQSIVSGEGGGLYLEVRGGSRLVISDSHFISNEAQTGGAFEIRLYDNSELVIHNTEVRSNLASTGNGGGGRILVESGSISITDSTFDDNQATNGEGGGLSIEKTGTGPVHLVLRNNTFTNNRASADANLNLEGNFIVPRLFLPVTRDPLVARITGISLQGSSYRVLFQTEGFVPQLPGIHLHFFFNTVPPEQAGMPGSGPWFVYGGGSPFLGYGPTNRPAGATQMCVLVANPNHSVQLGSGNCMRLP